MQQPNLPRYFYNTPIGPGCQYDTADEMAVWLLVHPREVDDYSLSMWRTAQSVASWGDYRTMRDTLNMLCDVMIALAKLRGVKYLE